MKYVLIAAGVLLIGILGYVAYAFIFRYDKIDLPDRTLLEQVYVERTEEGSYLLEFTEEGEYTIYQGTSEDNIDWTNPIATADEKIVKVPIDDFSKRYFFGIVNKKGERLIASERQIPMDGASNFRDLGGIPTKDGRVIKWGTFFRSGKLSELSDQDKRYFKTLGIHTIIDFRDDIEIANEPTQFPEDYNTHVVRVPIGDRSGNIQKRLKEQIRKADEATFNATEFVQDVNRQFIDTFAYQYKPFLETTLSTESTPLVYHCSAGKDRTGLATALLLATLGVDRDVILGDFMMSNYYRNEVINNSLRKASLAGISQRIARPLVEVDETYLAAAFDAIDKKYGNLDSFLRIEYGFTDEYFEKVRNLFTTRYNENTEVVTTEEAEEQVDVPKDSLTGKEISANP